MPSHKNTRRYDIWVYFLTPTIRIFICLLSFLNSWDLFHLLRYHLSMWNKFIFWIVNKKPAMRIFIQFFFFTIVKSSLCFVTFCYCEKHWYIEYWVKKRKEKEKSGSKVEWTPAKTLKGKFIASEARPSYLTMLSSLRSWMLNYGLCSRRVFDHFISLLHLLTRSISWCGALFSFLHKRTGVNWKLSSKISIYIYLYIPTKTVTMGNHMLRQSDLNRRKDH